MSCETHVRIWVVQENAWGIDRHRSVIALGTEIDHRIAPPGDYRLLDLIHRMVVATLSGQFVVLLTSIASD